MLMLVAFMSFCFYVYAPLSPPNIGIMEMVRFSAVPFADVVPFMPAHLIEYRLLLHPFLPNFYGYSLFIDGTSTSCTMTWPNWPFFSRLFAVSTLDVWRYFGVSFCANVFSSRNIHIFFLCFRHTHRLSGIPVRVLDGLLELIVPEPIGLRFSIIADNEHSENHINSLLPVYISLRMRPALLIYISCTNCV